MMKVTMMIMTTFMIKKIFAVIIRNVELRHFHASSIEFKSLGIIHRTKSLVFLHWNCFLFAANVNW